MENFKKQKPFGSCKNKMSNNKTLTLLNMFKLIKKLLGCLSFIYAIFKVIGAIYDFLGLNFTNEVLTVKKYLLNPKKKKDNVRRKLMYSSAVR